MKKIIWRKIKPIAYTESEALLYKHRRNFILEKDGNIIWKYKKKFNFLDVIKELNRIFQRAFRQDIRCSCVLNNTIYFVYGKTLYVCDIDKKRIMPITVFADGKVPLNIVESEFEEKYSILWGEYFANTKRESVKIYGLNMKNEVEEIYCFKAGSIRHIHNIISDHKKGYYILTGDNDKTAGIYYADSKFSIVKPIMVGKQKVRAVQGFPYENGMIYATDSVSSQNYIEYLHFKKEEWVIDDIAEINGSCIYATECKKGFVFSTSVESEEITEKSRFLSLFSRKRGRGILSDDVCLVLINRKMELREIVKFKKDRWPYKLFRYGVVMFPVGQKKNDTITIYPIGVKKFDGCMGIVDI